MANGYPQNNIASEVAASYDRPIAVSVISKLSKFPFLQQLGYNGQLGWLKQDFLGLQDFYEEMTLFSSAGILLKAAWQLISLRVPLNIDIAMKLCTSVSLGTVGKAFELMIGFNQIFAVSPDELRNSTGDSVVSRNLVRN